MKIANMIDRRTLALARATECGFKPPHPDRYSAPSGSALRGSGLPLAIRKKRPQDRRREYPYMTDAQNWEAATINHAHRHRQSKSAKRRYWRKERRIVRALRKRAQSRY